MYNTITNDDVYTITLTNTTYDNIIKHNQLTSANLQGDGTVGADNLNNTIEYNTPRDKVQTNTKITLENSTITADVNENITITATVTDIKNNLLLAYIVLIIIFRLKYVCNPSKYLIFRI